MSPGLAGKSLPLGSRHVVTCLFGTSVCHLDISCTVPRLYYHISCWRVPNDSTLIRMFAYPNGTVDHELVGNLLPGDLDKVTIDEYTDADWAGNSSASRSTGGLGVEVTSESSGRCSPIVGRASRHSFYVELNCQSELT